MRRSHLETLRPICPRCLIERQLEVPLVLASVIREEGDVIVEGILHCGDDACLQEYPVLDGIPIIVPNVRSFISDNLVHLTQRHDWSEAIESLLGDGAGPGSTYDLTRQHLSAYGWDHYHEFDPAKEPGDDRAGSMSRCLARALDLVKAPVTGSEIDIGCAVGRGTFDLAQQSDDLVLGVDVNFSMLQMAQTAMRSGVVRYPRRRVGIVYDRREFPVAFPGAERVDFWACDALALPFAEGSFTRAIALNVLDCVASPRRLLDSIAGVLTAGGTAILSTPYDWSGSVTPVEAWIGGHSQRGPDRGASEPLLRSLLTPGAHPQSSDRLKLTAEIEHVPWSTRVHDRSIVEYAVHLVVAEARG